MRKIILSTLTLLLSTTITFAQDNMCKVLASRGQSAIQVAGQEDANALKTGMRLNGDDKILLNEESYLGLVTTSGKTIELKEAGVYKVSDLLEGVKVDNSSLAQKYVAYVFESLRAGTDAHAQNMSITGSVERSAEVVAFDLMLPSETRVIPNENVIYWNRRENAPESVQSKVVIMNLFDEELAAFPAEENQAKVDFKGLGLEADEIYKIQVVSADGKNKSNVVTMKVPNEDDVKVLQSSIKELMTDFDENSALQNMVFASYLENQGLYLTAMSYYKKALSLEPEVPAFQEAFDDFMNKMGLASK